MNNYSVNKMMAMSMNMRGMLMLCHTFFVRPIFS